MPILKDSLTGIFDAIKEGALTLQQGGGIGYDFSCLRPEGSLVRKPSKTIPNGSCFLKMKTTRNKFIAPFQQEIYGNVLCALRMTLRNQVFCLKIPSAAPIIYIIANISLQQTPAAKFLK